MIESKIQGRITPKGASLIYVYVYIYIYIRIFVQVLKHLVEAAHFKERPARGSTLIHVVVVLPNDAPDDSVRLDGAAGVLPGELQTIVRITALSGLP